MSDRVPSEVTPAYRTLDEPTKLIGLSMAQWGAIALAGAIAYAWVLVSPLPWRLNVSLVVVLMGAPLMIALLREQGALSAATLFAAVCRWRLRPTLLLEGNLRHAAERGGVMLDEPAEVPARERFTDELPWLAGAEEPPQ